MKKTVIAAAVLCLTAGTPIYSFAADPCEVVLCMYGKATGNSGGSECSSAERAFFKINAFNACYFFHVTFSNRYFLKNIIIAPPLNTNNRSTLYL